MPTRALGDLRLKHSEFNFHNHPPELGYRKVIPTYNGPYITHEPEIKVFDITPNEKYLILGSDGLWDQIKEKDVKEVM